MKLLWSDNLKNAGTNFPIPSGTYGAFLIRYSGVPVGAISNTDLGNVILNRNGDDKINVDVDLISQIDNLYGGFIEDTLNAASDFEVSILIPCGNWNDKRHVYTFGANDKAFFKLDYPSLSPLITSGTVNIYGKEKAGIQSYWYKLLSKFVVSGGATAGLTDSILTPNICQLFLKNPAALVSNIQLIKDGKVFSDGDVSAELAYGNYQHEIESIGNMFAFEFCETGNVLESVNTQLTYKYTFTGAGTLQQYYSAIEFDAAQQAQSVATIRKSK
jgi:hypothetical protein